MAVEQEPRGLLTVQTGVLRAAGLRGSAASFRGGFVLIIWQPFPEHISKINFLY